MSVFDIFAEFVEDYTYLELSSTANGYKVDAEHEALGIAKIIEGKTEADNMEQATSDARLKIRTDEAFLPADVKSIVGNGIQLRGVDYRIDGVSLAQDNDFYNLNLVREEYTWQAALPSPLA